MSTVNEPRVLLVSPDGMLGRAFAALLQGEGVAVTEVGYPAFDLTKDETLDAVDWSAVDVVLNCSGWTDVDGAEANEAGATAVNGEGVGRLAQRCRDTGAVLVHYSTDYVFDGKATTPYPVDHPRSPVNAYGRSKAVGETRIELSGAEHLIIRTSWLYAPWGGNFVRTMARLGRDKDSLRVVHDQRGRPTSAEHLARATWALLGKGARGMFHVTDGGQCSWYELAKAVIESVDPTCKVEPCTSEEFVRPAPRPAYSVLDLSRTEALLGPMPAWQDNVADVLERLPSEG